MVSATGHFKRILVPMLLAFLLFAAFPAGGPWASALSTAAPKPIRVGSTILAPWHYIDKAGKEAGFETAILRDIGRRLKTPIQIVTVQWEGIFTGLLSGKYDVIASTVVINCERQQKFDFSVPYYDSGLSITVRKNDPRVNRVEDLRGLVVGVEGSGTVSHNFALENKDKYGIKEVKVYEDMASLMLEVQAGRIDAAIQDFASSSYYLKDKPALQVRVWGLTAALSGMVFRKGDPLRAKLDQMINALKKDGTMARIHREELGYQAPPGSVMVKVVPSFDACK